MTHKTHYATINLEVCVQFTTPPDSTADDALRALETITNEMDLMFLPNTEARLAYDVQIESADCHEPYITESDLEPPEGYEWLVSGHGGSSQDGRTDQEEFKR